MSLRSAWNDQFIALFGVESDWVTFIRGVVFRTAASLGPQSGLFDDLFNEVMEQLVIDVDKYRSYIEQVHATASDATSLLNGVKAVVGRVASFRASIVRRSYIRQYKTVQQFSQTEMSEPALAVIGNPYASAYDTKLANELESMAKEAERKPNVRLAKRYRRAADMVKSRVEGYTFDELKDSFDVKSKSTMAQMLDDMKQALARVVAKSDDPELLQSYAKYSKAS